ncbi:MAG: histidine phosphatase family protein [Pseudomonadota bacterium]|nr:histidine phosphatase family protein [Pseudomonadota bacterium]
MRHAKSSWNDKALDDRERPLSSRGRAAAPRMGRAIAERKSIPDLILCSPAKRTRQTLDLATGAMQAKPKSVISDALYVFGDGAAYLALINKQDKAGATLMIIGHNPSIAALADRLSAGGEERSLEAMRGKFPAAATACISFSAARWSDVGWGSGKLEWFLTPRTLDQAEP